MKFLKLTTSILFFLILAEASRSQELLYSDISGRLTDAQTSEIQKAEANIQKAEKAIDEAEVIEADYEALEKSDKEKKRKKFDKKTYEAKKLRIDSEKKYQKAYETVIGVYSDVITESEYYYDDDKTKASELNTEAKKLLKEADDKMKQYNKILTDNAALKELRYKTLTDAINRSRALKEEALQKQFEALDIIINQDTKKRGDEEDRLAWENALEENTVEAFEFYIEAFPKGKYVSQARTKISEILAKEEEAENQNITQNMGYVFKVQIAASKFPLSNQKLSKYYSETNKIDKIKVGKYYKYRVGSFNTYKEAEKFKFNLMSKVPDAFIVVFDKDGKQIEVTDEMKR